MQKIITKCPSCGAKVLSGEKSYYCENTKKNNCDLYIPKIFLGKEITEDHVIDLCTRGQTFLIYGFIGKSGKSFSAFLAFKETLSKKSKKELVLKFPSSAQKGGE